jgi:pimeloyl-ACP methyl ester carboxylesterase
MTGRLLQFASYTLDLDRLCLDGPSGAVDLRPKSFEVLRYLLEHDGRVVGKEEIMEAVWPDVTVTDESLTRCISEVRRALGSEGEAIIKTMHKRGYLLNVPVAVLAGELAELTQPRAPGSPTPPTPKQEIKYCRSPDGVRLAYAIAGRGPPLVKAGNWLHHLEFDWECPVWRHVLCGLAMDHTLVRYDALGNGLSDWEVESLCLDAWVSDLETIVEATGIERFPLLGISQGCAISVAYAVRHPERVSQLILYGGYVLGAKKRTREDREMRNAMLTLARLEWGSDNPAFRQIFTSNFIPDATREQADSFNELQRRTTSAVCAARYMDVTGGFDITDLLSRVATPTLVMHVRGDLMVPVDQGKALAAGIPEARFVTFPGRNHFFLEHEPASDRFFEEVALFLHR